MSTCSQASGGEEDEISVLEYARRNRLAYDHLAEPLPLTYAGVLDDLDDGTTDDSHLSQLKLPACNMDERSPLSRDAAMLLAWTSTLEKENLFDTTSLSLFGRRSRNKRLELPLLKSDHELDCWDFARREGFEIKLEDVKLPLETVHDEEGEGLVLPTELRDKGTQIMEELMKEKLPATKETLSYLSRALKMEWDQNADDEVWASVHTYIKVGGADSPIVALIMLTFMPELCHAASNATSIALTSTHTPLRTFLSRFSISTSVVLGSRLSYQRRPGDD